MLEAKRKRWTGNIVISSGEKGGLSKTGKTPVSTNERMGDGARRERGIGMRTGGDVSLNDDSNWAHGRASLSSTGTS